MSELPIEPCGAQYGHNPDRCYQPRGHAGTHSNRYGTTWDDEQVQPMPKADALELARAVLRGER